MRGNDLPADLISIKDEARTNGLFQSSRLPDTLNETALFSAVADDDLSHIMSIDHLSGGVLVG